MTESSNGTYIKPDDFDELADLAAVPQVHIRIHAKYQPSVQKIVPEATVTIDGDVESLSTDDGKGILSDAVLYARQRAGTEFMQSLEMAWTACQKVNRDLS